MTEEYSISVLNKKKLHFREKQSSIEVEVCGDKKEMDQRKDLGQKNLIWKGQAGLLEERLNVKTERNYAKNKKKKIGSTCIIQESENYGGMKSLKNVDSNSGNFIEKIEFTLGGDNKTDKNICSVEDFSAHENKSTKTILNKKSGKENRSKVKSFKSIKFNDKNDVFTYRSEKENKTKDMKREKSVKKIPSPDGDENCCFIM